MPIKTDFPDAIREIENTWIPLPDGARLAARIWLPQDAEQNPVPALLEYLPYRKGDGTAVRDALRHPYFAGHGYASIRVDMRGSGDSDGILRDEYLPQEQEDALHVLAWIAAQPWCSGGVGIFGKSWGGFNALQIAARRPPQLKAIVPMHFTDDRYADDVHYMGGCLLAAQMLPWACVMLAANAAPPDPRWVGERWREMWLARLEETPPYIEAWLSHQRRDAYWKHGSVCEDYSAIEVPVYAVGGWSDSYNNSIPRLLAGLNGPKKGIIGPWSHNFPETGVPGPAVGFLQEMVRWWDHWLKGIDSGIMDEPMLRTYIMDGAPPATHYAQRGGRWVGDPSWPSPHVQAQRWHLNFDGVHGALGETAVPSPPASIKGRQAHGLDGGGWGALGEPGEFPGDQRAADGESLTFTGAAVDTAVDLLGYPEVDLTLSADRPQALVAVRLCDVAPGGASTLVSYGLLNLTHRESHEFPRPLTPDEKISITVQLNVMGYRLPAGHRWRVGISPTYWQNAWPSPQPVTLTVYGGALRLPIRTPQPGDAAMPSFGPPETAVPLPVDILRTPSRQQTVTIDQITGVVTRRLATDAGHIRHPGGMETEDLGVETHIIREGDPLSAANRVQRTLTYRRGDWGVRIETDSTLTSTATHFHVTNALHAYEGETRVFARTWTFVVERDHL